MFLSALVLYLSGLAVATTVEHERDDSDSFSMFGGTGNQDKIYNTPASELEFIV